MTVQDGYIECGLRLPKGLHAEVKATAKRFGRSMNAEIIDRLMKTSERAGEGFVKSEKPDLRKIEVSSTEFLRKSNNSSTNEGVVVITIPQLGDIAIHLCGHAVGVGGES